MLTRLGLVSCLALAFSFTCAQPPTALVPLPEKIAFGKGFLNVGKGTVLVCDGANDPTMDTVRYLNDCLAKDAKMAFPLRARADARGGVTIRFTRENADPTLGDEGYALVVSARGITVRAPQPAGLFYGAQTVRQLVGRSLPAKVPFCTISDKPRFGWRGLLLDVSRHFRDKEFVKRYIDLLAFHKMNTLHWHLVDDQGWRLEIKRYPKLTQVGAWRIEDGKRYGGFYSQNDVREIVAYAKSRFVNVVPEIEMPGHSNAALASYPQYSCTGGPFATPSLWGVFADVFCPGNDQTFDFVQGILEETLALFPSTFIHIGGDEVPKTRWEKCPKCQARIKAEGLKDEHELQSYFIRRIDRWLADHGRRLVGWDEILEGGLAPGATVQSWRGMEGAVAAAKEGHDVVVSPTSHCYLDYPYTSTSVQKSYSFEPIPSELNAAEAKHVLGGEGNIWAELTPLPKDTDRQVFPRLSALSEVYWSPKTSRNWSQFSARLSRHLDTLAAMGVKFYIAPPTIETEDNVFLDHLTVKLTPGAGPVVYTLDGSDPTAKSPRYVNPIVLTQSATLKAASLRGTAVGPATIQVFKRSTLMSSIVFVRAPDPGLAYRYFEGSWSKVPNFEEMTPAITSSTEVPGVTMAKRPENYGLLLTGYFSAPKDGIYTFYLNSDDGSKLWIGDQSVVDNDGLHAPDEKWGQVALRAGWHPIKIGFFQGTGGQTLALSVKEPGGKRRVTKASDFGH